MSIPANQSLAASCDYLSNEKVRLLKEAEFQVGKEAFKVQYTNVNRTIVKIITLIVMLTSKIYASK